MNHKKLNFIMSKIIETLASLPKDKLLHSFYGTLLYSLVSFVSPVLAIVIVFVVAIAREIWNESGVSLLDILATVLIPSILFVGDLQWVK